MEIVTAIASFACALRFASLLWHGYRYGQVKSATPWSGYYDRQTNRIIYWMFMALHAAVLLVCLGCVAYVAFDLLRAPRPNLLGGLSS
jgi:hypothetical protein